jgi:hypothetical protein
MEKWLMVSDDISTSLVHEDDYKDPNKKHWFYGKTKIITEFVVENWEEASKLYNEYLNKYGK